MALNSFMNDWCGYAVTVGEFTKGIATVDLGRFFLAFNAV